MKCLTLLLLTVALTIAQIPESKKHHNKRMEQDFSEDTVKEDEELDVPKLDKHGCGYCKGIWRSCTNKKIHSNKCMRRVIKCLKKFTKSTKCDKTLPSPKPEPVPVSPSPKEPVPLSPSPKEKCPEDEGFFTVPGSTQCLKTWWGPEYGYFTKEEADRKCTNEGLVLAKPEIPHEVQKYLNVKYGGFWYWIGVINNGSHFKWKADGTVVDPTLIETTKGGTCLGLNARGVRGHYNTVVPPGVPYSSDDCSESYGKAPLCEAPCVPSCKNGGTCWLGRCICPPGLTGETCETAPCVPSCKNGGTCWLGRCICPPGLTGETCETAPCVPSCKNGGTCWLGRCICPPGLTGETCETEPVPLSPSPKGGTKVTSSFRLTNKEYNDNLGNPYSPEFAALKQEVEESVKPALQKKLGDKLIKFTVTGFGNGSVIVDSDIITTVKNPRDALNSVSNALKTSGIKGLDPSSVTVKESSVKDPEHDNMMFLIENIATQLKIMEKKCDEKISNITSGFDAKISNINDELKTLTKASNIQCQYHCARDKGICKNGMCHCLPGLFGPDCNQGCAEKSECNRAGFTCKQKCKFSGMETKKHTCIGDTCKCCTEGKCGGETECTRKGYKCQRYGCYKSQLEARNHKCNGDCVCCREDSDKCEDYDASWKCRTFKMSGLCGKPITIKGAKTNCKKTCNLCGTTTEEINHAEGCFNAGEPTFNKLPRCWDRGGICKKKCTDKEVESKLEQCWRAHTNLCRYKCCMPK